MFICRPESRFLELIPREESEDSESSIPRLILKRQNTPSDESTPPKVLCNFADENFYNTFVWCVCVSHIKFYWFLFHLQIDSPVLIHSMEDKRSKSIEEREEEYHKARERIFNQDVSFCGSMTGLVCDLETGYSSSCICILQRKAKLIYCGSSPMGSFI